mmetsp:Transcript_398/g.590  ORF Transcript_398/g.590 Transcript_398/m.590 type:complete len:242 (-) Transcript_398:133-858(-)
MLLHLLLRIGFIDGETSRTGPGVPLDACVLLFLTNLSTTTLTLSRERSLLIACSTSATPTPLTEADFSSLDETNSTTLWSLITSNNPSHPRTRYSSALFNRKWRTSGRTLTVSIPSSLNWPSPNARLTANSPFTLPRNIKPPARFIRAASVGCVGFCIVESGSGRPPRLNTARESPTFAIQSSCVGWWMRHTMAQEPHRLCSTHSFLSTFRKLRSKIFSMGVPVSALMSSCCMARCSVCFR